jgi:hypothetical protein
MAKSQGRSPHEEPEQSLLSWLRGKGDALEAASPPFDTSAAAARLRSAAESQALLRPGRSPAADLRDTGVELEETAPPFDVEAGAARLREAALAHGLMEGNKPSDSALAVSRTVPLGHERPEIQESEPRSFSPRQEDLGEADRLTAARVHFTGSVRSRRRTVGGLGAAHEMAQMTLLPEEEISAALDHYVKSDMFGRASSALHNRNIIAMTGAAGSGKRTSAIALLRQVTHESLIVLSSAISLEGLASNEYQPGLGYAVIDWRNDQDPANSQHFHWLRIRDKLTAVGAFLIVTTERWASQETIPHFRWEPPSPSKLLAAYLTGTTAEGRLDEVIGKLPDRCEVSSVVSLARALAAGADLNATLRRLRDEPAEHVRRWFHDSPISDILTVTALVFMEGQDERVFEALLQQLKEGAESTGRIQMRAGHRGLLPQARAVRPLPDELIARTMGSAGRVDKTLVNFRMSGFRRHILAELCRDWDSSFWDVVRHWLASVIQLEAGESASDLQVTVAAGLADLALSDMGQVERAYLDPWAAGEVGWAGRTVATYVLWWMSFESSLAPTALRIAEEWANSTNSSQVWTAAMALSGDLGAAYPAQALRSLGRIITRTAPLSASAPLSTDAIWALAQLFATLVGNGQDTAPLLHLLETLMTADSRIIRMTAQSATLMTLSIKEPESGIPAVALVIHADRMSHITLARLWARVLSTSSTRRQALTALMVALSALEHISATPEEDARAFGDTMGEMLTFSESAKFTRDVADLMRTRRRPAEDIMSSFISQLEDV